MSHTESKINLTHVFGALFNSKLLHLWTLTGDKKKKNGSKKYQLQKLTNVQQKIMKTCSGFIKLTTINRKM